ncbi:MAG: hypothetical protein JSW11_01630 [Candidatus Heimdallarchaeota archaeon]|nr:MAG: hypothetical protein JSW11_01630 [Candidatus Heimdallarchaeota archaeon]
MLDEYLLLICIIGIPDELKTRMVRTFAEGKFTTDYLPTLGFDITTKQIQVDNSNIKLILVDTSGQEFFDELRSSHYRTASAAIITFDKGDRDSFIAVKKWYKEFVNEINRFYKKQKTTITDVEHDPRMEVPIALVGFITKEEPITPTFLKIQKRLDNTGDWIDWTNNKEIYEEITTAEGQSLAEELGLSFYETRPTDKKISEQIFHDLTLQVLRRRTHQRWKTIEQE